jgi:carbon storage regulator
MGENMLILTRRPGEAILIGEEIEILVKEVGRNHVRLGINAPKSVTIRRLETLGKPKQTEESDSEADQNR